ncbi:flagellar hook-basal body protein [Virgibacillus proomii]|uniref:flagellar hook-basal body protein n=1 Tax=Virgibacillus proomii TaxID=84407 RepID=UPI001C0FCEDF|nr:flagellar hook-basal body protein [Virgibacillus proomii]MBU5268017.1 flagellar hook-basal body protein [Virgibacillus proomii]
MSRTMIQAAVTMNQLQNKLDVIGNNLANSQTTGYKNRQANFSSLLFQQMNNLTDPRNAEGRLTPDGLRIGTGAKLGAINSNMQLGALQNTDRALDTALLDASHLYQVQVIENGVTETRYTRDGAFYLSPVNNNQQVMLTNSDGNPVLGINGPIVINEGFDDITLLPNGEIRVTRGATTEIAGRVAVVEAVRPHLLEATGENLFRLPNVAELGFNIAEIIQPVGENEQILKGGTLEASNVDMSQEMSELIMTQRAYQSNARTISMSDQMLGLINQLR